MNGMGKPAAFVLYALVLVMSVCVRALRINGLDCISHCNRGMRGIHKLHMSTSVAVLPSVFQENKESFLTTDNVKMQILQLGATLDRGQVYNPTSGEQYKQNMDIARKKIELLISKRRPNSLRFRAMEGEWELVLSTVPHGIFRSSPFFLAIQQAYADVGQADKALLFFKLHELQTMSWGVSKIGRVAQFIDTEKGTLTSEFDTNIFSMTVIPILGWGKLLPTFGGCVETVSDISMKDDDNGLIELEVDYTTASPVEGLAGLNPFGWFENGGLGIGTKVPVGAVWKLLPWNKGEAAKAQLLLKYIDDDFRIVQDVDGEYFVYTRPVVSRKK